MNLFVGGQTVCEERHVSVVEERMQSSSNGTRIAPATHDYVRPVTDEDPMRAYLSFRHPSGAGGGMRL